MSFGENLRRERELRGIELRDIADATKISMRFLQALEQDRPEILPGGIFPQEKEKLTYYNLSAGYNVLPGEVFIGGKRAKPSAFYLIGGVGSTKFADQRRPTFNVGAGLRVFLSDRVALQVDARDHIFSLDLLGQRQSTQNLELSAGITAFF